jgi:hypothetical protein
MPLRKRQKLKALGKVKKGSDQRYKQVYVTNSYDQSHKHRLVGVSCPSSFETAKGAKTSRKRFRFPACT